MFLVHHVVAAFGHECLEKSDSAEILCRCFRVVKSVSGHGERDGIVRLQAQRTMKLLDQIARSYFPHDPSVGSPLNIRFV